MFDLVDFKPETLIDMILTLIFLAAIGVVMLSERSIEHLLFAVAAFCFSAAVLLLGVADFDRAILLAGLLVVSIAAASTIKYNHSALKLTVTDLPLLFAGTFRSSSCNIRARCSRL